MVWVRRNRNFSLIFFLVLLVGGYLFFFTSNLWMPASGNAEKQTAFNREFEYNDRRVTLLRWDYCRTQKKMEVELEIENDSFDGVDAYRYEAVTNGGKNITVTPLVEDPDYVVLSLTDVPKKWAEISLHLEMPEGNTTAGGEILKLYTNIREVNQVSDLQEKSRKEYLLQRMDTKIGYYASQTEELEADIQEQKQIQKTCQSEIERLKEKEKYQTDEEIQETEKRIDEAELKSETAQESIQESEDAIREYQEKTEKAKEKRQEIQETETE